MRKKKTYNRAKTFLFIFICLKMKTCTTIKIGIKTCKNKQKLIKTEKKLKYEQNVYKLMKTYKNKRKHIKTDKTFTDGCNCLNTNENHIKMDENV